MPELPFPAIVDQRDLKTALLLNAINRSLGGVLVRGERGTGKSTTVRSLQHVLPTVPAVADCVFNCHPTDEARQCATCAGADDLEVEHIRTPVVELPLGATEDRVVGSLDFERALGEGVNALAPGLLARANRGVLYIDEVNLLDDHLVDLLLDAAASGVNRVERESVSVRHPADFILVGTMNPSEGKLRPQLLDRFGLQVDAKAPTDPQRRRAIIGIAERFDRDPEGVIEHYADAEAEVRRSIEDARDRYDAVELPGTLEEDIVEVCIEAGVEGTRGDVIAARCARTLAAFEGRDRVEAGDVRLALRLALGHRVPADPLGEGTDLDALIADQLGDDAAGEPTEEPGGDPRDDGPAGSESRSRRGESRNRRDETNLIVQNALDGVRSFLFGPEEDDGDDDGGPGDGEKRPGGDDAADQARSRLDPIGPGEAVAGVEGPSDPPTTGFEVPERAFREEYAEGATDWLGAGRREGRAGRYVSARRATADDRDLAMDASLRSAASRGASAIDRDDLRVKVRDREAASLLVFAVDTSASMRSHGHLERARRLMTELFDGLDRAAEAVAVVAFRDEGADIVVPPTTNVRRAVRKLDDLPTGNKTPLAHGLYTALRLVQEERSGEPDPASTVVVVTDGRPTVAVNDDPVSEANRLAHRLAEEGVRFVVLDTDTGVTGSDVCRDLADAGAGACLRLADLEAGDRGDRLVETVETLHREAGPP